MYVKQNETKEKMPLKCIIREVNYLLEFLSKSSLIEELCGRSSVGRAPPCQGGCRGFESLRPLHFTLSAFQKTTESQIPFQVGMQSSRRNFLVQGR